MVTGRSTAPRPPAVSTPYEAAAFRSVFPGASRPHLRRVSCARCSAAPFLGRATFVATSTATGRSSAAAATTGSSASSYATTVWYVRTFNGPFAATGGTRLIGAFIVVAASTHRPSSGTRRLASAAAAGTRLTSRSGPTDPAIGTVSATSGPTPATTPGATGLVA